MPLAFTQNAGPNTRLQKADTPVAHSLAKQMHTKPPPHPETPSWAQHITKTQAGGECKGPMLVSHHGAPLRSPMYHLSNSPQELISSQRWKPPTTRFLQEASSTPLLLPRLEVREPPAGATCSKTLLTTRWSWPNIHKEMAVTTQSPFFFYSAIENLVPAWRPGIPPPILPGTQGRSANQSPRPRGYPDPSPNAPIRADQTGPTTWRPPKQTVRGWKNKERGLTPAAESRAAWTLESCGPPTGSHGSEPSRGSKGLCGLGTRSLPERGAER